MLMLKFKVRFPELVALREVKTIEIYGVFECLSDKLCVIVHQTELPFYSKFMNFPVLVIAKSLIE